MNSEKKKIEKFTKNLLIDIPHISQYYNWGIRYFGPFLYGYTHWLYHSAMKSQCKRLFFFSRDGYMMEKAFRVLNFNNTIKCDYVYFSRKSIRQALLSKCISYKDSLKYLTWERFVSLGKLLEYYGFSADERYKIAKKFNMDLKMYYAYSEIEENKQLKALYESIKHDIYVNSSQQAELLESYLLQIEMTGECAIVDIGWHGSMQYYLEEFIRVHKLKTTLTGFYVGINPVFPLSGTYKGYLYNPNDLRLRKKILCFFGGYEKLFQSCEGSTYGYIDNQGCVYPHLTDYEYKNDSKFIYYIKEWQKGAIDFVIAAGKERLTVSDEKIWAYSLIKFGMNPSNKDLKLFGFLYNTDGNTAYFISQKPLYKYTPSELLHALSNSAWKTGFMKSIFRFPFPYYSIYRLMKR